MTTGAALNETRCGGCGTPCRITDRFCSQCGRRDPAMPVADGTTRESSSYTTIGPHATPSEQDDALLAPGSIFARRYRIERLIGEGGMGRVYLATDTTIYEPIALKFVSGSHRSNPGILEQFKHELKLARRIRHRNVAASFHLGEAEGRAYITQEYIDAESLAGLLHRRGPIGEAEAFRILRQVLCGLKAAHDLGIVHRDIKASNILVNKDGMAFITDFGLAISTAQVSGVLMAGTPEYMAPELWLGVPPTPSSDLYACGVLLFHMLTRRFPFSRDALEDFRMTGTVTPPELIPVDLAVSAVTRQLYARLLAGDLLVRPARAVDVLEVVDRVLALDALAIKAEQPVALVADADEGVRAIAREELEREGYQVEMASSASEVVDLAFSLTPSFVVLDSNVRGAQEISVAHDSAISFVRDILPHHAGLGLCRLLQHDERLRRVPILVTTAEAHPGVKPAFMLMGAAEVIPKPFTTEDFATGLRNARHAALARAEEA